MRDDGFLQNGAQGQWRNHTAESVLFCVKGTFYRALTFAQWSQYLGYMWNTGEV